MADQPVRRGRDSADLGRYLLLLVGFAAALLASIYWFEFAPNDERTQLLVHESSGTVVSGTRLGVSVGDSWVDADAALRARFTPASVLWLTGRMATEGGTGELGRAAVLVGDAEVSYKDGSWRNGWVTLSLRDGRVTRISWAYCPFCIVI